MINADFIKKLVSLESGTAQRQKVRDLINLYEDNWDYLIQERLKRKYPETHENLFPKITKEFNLHKRIVDEIVNGGAYCEEVSRKAIIGQGGSEAKEDETYAEAIATLDLDSTFEHAQRYVLASRAVALQVTWSDDTPGAPAIHKHYFDNFRAFYYRSKLIAVEYYSDLILPDDYNGFNEYYQLEQYFNYTRRYLYTLEEGSGGSTAALYTFKSLNGSEQPARVEVLPYRDENGNAFLPFVILTADDTSTGGGSPLNFTKGDYIIDATLAITDRIIHLDHLADTQSWNQVVRNVVRGTEVRGSKRIIENGREIVTWPKVVLSPDTIAFAEIDEAGNGGYEIMNMDTPQFEKWQFIKERAITLLSNEGISPDNYTLSATPASGFALQISNRALNERRRRDIKRFRKYEKELFSIFRSVWNYHNPQKIIDVKATLSIDYPSREGLYSVQEETLREQHDIEYGMDHPIRILARKKGIPLEDAKKEYEENIKWKKQYEPKVTLDAPGNGNNA